MPEPNGLSAGAMVFPCGCYRGAGLFGDNGDTMKRRRINGRPTDCEGVLVACGRWSVVSRLKDS